MAFKVIIVFLIIQLKTSVKKCKFIQDSPEKYRVFGEKFRANTEFLSRRVGF
jgi:hypothetical protein